MVGMTANPFGAHQVGTHMSTARSFDMLQTVTSEGVPVGSASERFLRRCGVLPPRGQCIMDGLAFHLVWLCASGGVLSEFGVRGPRLVPDFFELLVRLLALRLKSG